MVDELWLSTSHEVKFSCIDLGVLFHGVVLIPIPLHRDVLRERGFNQAEHVALWLSTLLNIPVANILEKKVERSRQSQLPTSDRSKNVRGAFVVKKVWKEKIKDKRVYLVDDVITTGATLQEAARALAPYTKHIYGITLLRSFK